MSTIVTVLTATDLHQRKSLYDELERVVNHHRPDIVALVGDFLDAGDHRAGRYTAAESAEHLSRLASPHVVFVRGNHEEEAWQAFAAAWSETGRRLNALHGEVFVHGPMVLVGFPCLLGDETSYLGPRPAPRSVNPTARWREILNGLRPSRDSRPCWRFAGMTTRHPFRGSVGIMKLARPVA